MFVATNICVNKCFVAIKLCRNKHTTVATKEVFCRDKHVLCLSRQQQKIVATKIILVASPVNDMSEDNILTLCDVNINVKIKILNSASKLVAQRRSSKTVLQHFFFSFTLGISRRTVFQADGETLL